MKKFVGALKKWAKFEFILTVVGILSILLAFANAQKHHLMTEEMAILYVVFFFALLIRLFLTYDVGFNSFSGAEGDEVEVKGGDEEDISESPFNLSQGGGD